MYGQTEATARMAYLPPGTSRPPPAAASACRCPAASSASTPSPGLDGDGRARLLRPERDARLRRGPADLAAGADRRRAAHRRPGAAAPRRALRDRRPAQPVRQDRRAAHRPRPVERMLADSASRRPRRRRTRGGRCRGGRARPGLLAKLLSQGLGLPRAALRVVAVGALRGWRTGRSTTRQSAPWSPWKRPAGGDHGSRGGSHRRGHTRRHRRGWGTRRRFSATRWTSTRSPTATPSSPWAAIPFLCGGLVRLEQALGHLPPGLAPDAGATGTRREDVPPAAAAVLRTTGNQHRPEGGRDRTASSAPTSACSACRGRPTCSWPWRATTLRVSSSRGNGSPACGGSWSAADGGAEHGLHRCAYPSRTDTVLPTWRSSTPSSGPRPYHAVALLVHRAARLSAVA